MMDTKKCVRTFPHKRAVTAIAILNDMCVSGSEEGEVKVWNVRTGKLVKVSLKNQTRVFRCCAFWQYGPVKI